MFLKELGKAQGKYYSCICVCSIPPVEGKHLLKKILHRSYIRLLCFAVTMQSIQQCNCKDEKGISSSLRYFEVPDLKVHGIRCMVAVNCSRVPARVMKSTGTSALQTGDWLLAVTRNAV